MSTHTFWTRAVRVMLGGMAAASLSLAAIAQSTPIAFKIGAAGATDHAPAFVGVERAIFAKHGLDVKVVMYETGVDMLNGLLNGAQDVNIMGSVPFLAGVSRGQPLVLIGHLHNDARSASYSTNVSIVASPNAGVREGDIKALKGKRIGLPRGSGAEGYILNLLDQAGAPSLPGADGSSFLGLARDARAPWLDLSYSEYCTDGSARWDEGNAVVQRMVRLGSWKYIYYHGYPPQLFDLACDPLETRDLAHSPAHASLCRQLETLVRRNWDPDQISGLLTAKRAEKALLGQWWRTVRPPDSHRWQLKVEDNWLDHDTH